MRSIFRSHKFTRFFYALFVCVFLITSCQFPWQKTIPTQEAVQPTEKTISSPTPAPRADLPPTLLEVYPLPGSVIALQETITFIFNQPMDKTSVEAAMQNDPAISGEFSWEDDYTMSFTPDQPLLPDSTWTITFDTHTGALNGKFLQQETTVSFKTAKDLEATQLLPSISATEVDPNSAVVVSFNQPVVALGQEDAPAAFSISPSVEGSGEWINTSTYVFTAQPGLAGGTKYTVTLNKNLVSVFGAPLTFATQSPWTFTTTMPQVQSITPDSYSRLPLDGKITIDFNIRMDTTSVENAFMLLTLDYVAIRGDFTWNESETQVTFTAKNQLDYATIYEVVLGSEMASFGGIKIGSETRQPMLTYPIPFFYQPEGTAYESGYWGISTFRIDASNPLDASSIKDTYTITPAVPDVTASVNTYSGGDSIYFNGSFEPGKTYTISVDANVKDIWGHAMTDGISHTFTTPDAKPAFHITNGSLYYSNLVFLDAADTEITAEATNISRANLSVMEYKPDYFMAPIFSGYASYEYIADSHETSQPITILKNKTTTVNLPLRINNQPLQPGVYRLEVETPEAADDWNQGYHEKTIVVSHYNVVFKLSQNKALVWVTSLKDQTPLADTPVSIHVEKDIIAQGKTNAQGLFITDLDLEYDIAGNYVVVVSKPGQADFALTTTEWHAGDLYWRSGITQTDYPDTQLAYTYTDRPIYRPGQTVYFRSTLRDFFNDSYTLPEATSVRVKAFNSGYESSEVDVFFDQTLKLSPYGSVNGEFTLPENLIPGSRAIYVYINGKVVGSINYQVQYYRKPEIDLKVNFSPDPITAKQALNATIQADYYFGIPAQNLSVTWSVSASRNWFDMGGYQSGTSKYFTNEFIDTGNGRTDENGQLNFNIAQDALSKLSDHATITLSATITDQNNLTTNASGAITFHPDVRYIGVEADQHIANADQPINYDLLVVDWEKQPLPNIPLDVAFSQVTWKESGYYNDYGFPIYTRIVTPLNTASPVSSENGQAKVAFTPTVAGVYELSVTSNNAKTTHTIWVVGKGAGNFPKLSGKIVSLEMDAKTYKPGDTANIFIPNPFGEAGGTALVTLERNTIHQAEIVAVDGAGVNYQVQITDEQIPNIYLAVTLLGDDAAGNPDYRNGIVNLPVDSANKTLNVTISIDAPQTTPGASVKATINVTDAEGKPVQGEFSLSVVDKAVLALMKPNAPTIQDGFYNNVPLAVRLSNTLVGYTVIKHIEVLGRGGGGGDGDYINAVRDEFKDTAYWNGSIVTGKDGTAVIDVVLPDNLTTWVVEARGITAITEVGSTQSEIVTAKALMVRPQTPRFLVAGDHLQLGAVIHNNTSQPQKTVVSISPTGFSLDAPDDHTRTVEIAANDSIFLAWWGTVENVENVELVFSAQADELSDATTPTQGSIPVLRYLSPMTFSTAGQMDAAGNLLEVVSLPRSYDVKTGSLSVEVSPSLTAVMIDELDTLQFDINSNNPIDAISVLLANTATYKLVRAMGIKSQINEEDMVNLIKSGVAKLASQQNHDGGWLWYSTGNRYENFDLISDPVLSAMVLHTFNLVKEANISVNNTLYDELNAFVKEQIPDLADLKSMKKETRQYEYPKAILLLYTLEDMGSQSDDYLNLFFENRQSLSPWSQAMLAELCKSSYNHNKKAQTLYSDLESSAIRMATGLYWEDNTANYTLPSSILYNTAVITTILAKNDPANPMLTDAVKYLMNHRNDVHQSSFDHAWLMLAIAASIKGKGDVQADFSFEAALNDVQIISGKADSAGISKPVTATFPLSNLHQVDPNALIFSRGAGTGKLYYQASLEIFRDAADAPAFNRGINLTRQYLLIDKTCAMDNTCPSIEAVNIKAGELPTYVTVKLTITLDHAVQHLVLEDYIPAGVEIYNPIIDQSKMGSEIVIKNWQDWRWYYFSAPKVYDDHISFAADYLPAGTYDITYVIIPTTAGEFQVLPAHAWVYYYPEMMGTSKGNIFTINEE